MLPLKIPIFNVYVQVQLALDQYGVYVLERLVIFHLISPGYVRSKYLRKLSHLVIVPFLYSSCQHSVQNFIFVTFNYSNVASRLQQA